MDQKKLAPYFIAIEQIKTGYVCDVRYHFTDWDFDSPRVWLFMNESPPTCALSRDRWKFWSVDPDTQNLVPFQPEEYSFDQ